MLLLKLKGFETLPLIHCHLLAEKVFEALWVVLGQDLSHQGMFVDACVIHLGVKSEGFIDLEQVFFEYLRSSTCFGLELLLDRLFDGYKVLAVLAHFNEADFLLVLTFCHLGKVVDVHNKSEDCKIAKNGLVGCPETTELSDNVTKSEKLIFNGLFTEIKLKIDNKRILNLSQKS